MTQQQQKKPPLGWSFSVEYLTEWGGVDELQVTRCSLSDSLALVQLWEFWVH